MTQKKPQVKARSARAQAAGLLTAVLKDRRTLDEAIAATPLMGSAEDQRFAMALVLTVLQHLGQLNAVIETYLEKPLPPKRMAVMNALRIGAAQLLLMDTPAHAAVSESVNILKVGKDAGFAGLVNAVLKKIAAEKPALPSPLANLPEWLRARWEKAYGTAAVEGMAQLASTKPPLDVNIAAPHPESRRAIPTSPKGEVNGVRSETEAMRLAPVTSPKGEVENALAFSGEGNVRQLDAHMLRLAPGHPPVEALPGFAEGAFFVQDVAASYPVRLLGEVREHQVLDICAAPGGKTMQLIRAGAFVTALDRAPARMKRVKENLKRMGMQANTIVADAFEWQPSRAYDAVLLDAPCTATGIWRRHPEVVQQVSPEEIAEMATLQRALMQRAWAWVKPGGRMVYCVCSLEAEEGEAQAAWFLDAMKDAVVAPPPNRKGDSTPPQGGSWPEIPPEYFTPEGFLRTHPALMQESGGMDGFFAVCFTKRDI